MIPKSKYKQYGVASNRHLGIVVHNTNSPKSARQLEKWLAEEHTGSNGCHFLVDADEVVKVMPLTWSAFNCGNGMAFGNLDTIAIEICTHISTADYLKAEARAIELIRDLMQKYSISKEQIYFHRDFQPNVNCPAQILKRYGSKANFLSKI